MGGNVGEVAQGGRARGQMGGGGAPESRLVPPNNWSDLAEEGGVGGNVGEVGEGRARGEMGGGTREQCGSNKGWTNSPFWAPFKTSQLV